MLLAPAGAAYGAHAGRRMLRPPAYHSRLPVICVGSFTVGGDGKTPTAIALAGMLQAEGASPAFLTRGYRGTAAGPIMIDLRDDPRRTGDEPRLLAAVAPTAVSADRPRGARLLEEQGAGIIVMDDGFQNPSLAKDLSLAVVDGAAGIGNGLVTPAGPLRAPLRSQIARADAVVLIGEGPAESSIAGLAADAGKPLLRARLVADDPAKWNGERVVAFGGIGRPEKFFATLEAAGAEVVRRRAFPDHHFYSERDAAEIIALADAAAAKLVTTAKDHARLAAAPGALGELRRRSEMFAVRLEFENADIVKQMLREAMAKAARR